jgi:hypothetical protein
MSLEWFAAVAFAILLALFTWLRQSGPDWIEPAAIVLMIVSAVGLVASFLAAILLPIVFRRR